MYTLVLSFHSIVRWGVVILGAIAAARALAGWLAGQDWETLDDQLGLFFTTAIDIQWLLGLLLYFFLSPITQNALQDFGAAMANGAQRFWAVEHVSLMIMGVILAHVGRALAGRARGSRARHQRAAVFFALAMLVLLIAIPWPFREVIGRPWIRVQCCKVGLQLI